MNKRDFYREIMSEFEFDKEKIMNNAKKGKFAGRSPMPLYIGMTAAAAVAVVAAGTMIFTNIGKTGGVDLVTSGGLTAMTNQQRVEKAIEDIRSKQNSNEHYDVLVTFIEPLSAGQVADILTANAEGSIPVKMLYFADGTRVVGTENVGYVFENGGEGIEGAVINCAGYLMAQLERNGKVAFAEIMTENDDLNLVAPIDTNDPEIDHADFTDPDFVDNTDSSSETDSGESDVSDGGESGFEDNSSEDSSESGETTSEGGENEPAAEEGIPEGVTLPFDIEQGVLYLSENIGASSAFFISDDVIYANTESGVSLYKYTSGAMTKMTSQDCQNARVEWISENGKNMLVSASENGRRTKLYAISAAGYSIKELNVKNMIMGGSLNNVRFNEACGILALEVNNGNDNYICSMNFDGYNEKYLRVCLFSKGGGASILAIENGYVYAAAYSGGITSIIKAPAERSGESVEIARFEGSADITANYAATYGVVSKASGEVMIFDPQTETLLRAPENSMIQFGASRNCLYCAGDYYMINSGEITPTGGVSVIKKIDFEQGFSSKYAADVLNGAVVINTSAYSTTAENEFLAFGPISEEATASMKKAVSLGIGVQNAIASGTVKNCGINSSEALCSTINAIYTPSAAEALISKCRISKTGALSYSTDGVGIINASDSVLVISEDNGYAAAGTLYVSAGCFNGKTGYFAKSVSLIRSGSEWKLDGIIG